MRGDLEVLFLGHSGVPATPRVETPASTERQLHWQDGGLFLFSIADEKSDFL
jgi:hypothetical protein